MQGWYPHQFRKPLNALFSMPLSFLSHSPLFNPLYASFLFNMKYMILAISWATTATALFPPFFLECLSKRRRSRGSCLEAEWAHWIISQRILLFPGSPTPPIHVFSPDWRTFGASPIQEENLLSLLNLSMVTISARTSIAAKEPTPVIVISSRTWASSTARDASFS